MSRRSRLTEDAMDAIVFAFVAGSPASEVAAETRLNLKTVQFYFSRIRELLARDRESQLAESYGSAQVSHDLFASSDVGEKWRNAIFMGCLVSQENEMELLFADHNDTDNKARLASIDVSGWLVAADRNAYENLQLDRIFCLPGKNAKERAHSFWANAKHRLSAYCGGFKKHFKLYLREMEFRNNITSTTAAREQIGDLLNQNKSRPGGEEDA